MATANCPTCGGPLEFKIASSWLVVCPHCKSAISRTDRKLEDMGKVADLVETESPLSVGMAGKYFNATFRLTGRAQLRHQVGGVWDEWYAAFSDGRWGWLAEAQGRFFMTFKSPLETIPPQESLHIGEPAPGMPVPMVVSEIGMAHYTSAEGEIPFAFVPGEALHYADLSGAENTFATLDYSDAEEPIFYAGREVTLAELHVDVGAAQPKKEARAQVTNLGCPNCGGSLELRAPDKTEHVGCPYCGALLDASEGKFKVLDLLSGKLEKPLLPLGATAPFDGTTWMVIGFLKRSCVVEGTKYYWNEYLLYEKLRGFRWLVHSDNHWTFVKTIPTADVKVSAKYAYYEGKSYQRFQDAPARVEMVVGEFYWKVTVGEEVQASDFVRPPKMLSCEVMKYEGGGSEVAWSLGEYVFPEEIQQKFKVSVRRPSTVGACEPFRHTGYFWLWAAMLAMTIVSSIAITAIKPEHEILNQQVTLEPLPATPATQATPVAIPAPGQDAPPPNADPNNAPPLESGQVWISSPVELSAREFIDFKVETQLDNAWLSLDCDLINEETGEVQPFDLQLEYYHGYEDGESWSEGSKSNSTSLSAIPGGKYTLRLEAHWDKQTQPISFQFVLSQGGVNSGHCFLMFLAITLIPCIVLVMKYLHYSGRWKESMYGE